MANSVGVDLRCTIDMVNQNLDQIANMEQARRDIYLQSLKNKEEKRGELFKSIDIGDADLEDLCSEADHSDVELELDYYDNLKKIFSSNKK